MIENLIFDALKGIPYVSGNTARYSNSPAVFYQQAPHDYDKLWGKGGMFPRVIYNVNWGYQAERRMSGVMTAEVFCSNENEVSPEEIGRRIIEGLSELFLTDESGTYCLLWNNTDHLNADGPEPLVCGAIITFDMICFPLQEGVDPCPVWAANNFIKEMQPNCVLIGHDRIPTYLKATARNPIVYVKKANTSNLKTNYAMAWMSGEIMISVLSSDLSETRKWIDAILRDFRIEGETVMKNGSPFLIKSIQESTSHDALKTGQIVLTGEYGVMRRQKEEMKLNNVHFEKEEHQ